MKRTMLALIAICVCIAFSACRKECVHEFDSTVTTASNCLQEGIRTNTCKLCEFSCTEPIPTTDHDYDEGVVTAEASCTAEGAYTYTCSICGDTKTEPISMMEHQFDEGVETKAATCSEKGVLTYTCQYCGETKTGEIDTLEHTFGQKTVTSEATCVAEGEISATCTLCGFQELVEKTPKSDKHDYKDNVIRKPTCTERGKGEKVCKLCGHSVDCDYDLAEHSYGDAVVTKEASCSAKGEKTYTCSVCGHAKTSSISKKDHVWGDADCNSYAKCTACGSKNTKKTGHDYVFEKEYKYSDNFAGKKTSRCTRCNKTKTVLSGKHGKYDLDAAENAGLKRAKELGFGTGTVTTENNDARGQKISRYFYEIEFDGGQKGLEKVVVLAVNRLYNGYRSNASKYNVKVTVSYNTSGSLGTGFFIVTATAHYKE